jgi:hypothetical protein
VSPAGIVVLVPVLRRPWRAAPTVEAFARATEPPYRIVFICTPDDTEEIAAVRATGAARLIVPWETGPGDWARKINYGFRSTMEPLMLLGADDICPHPGWAEEVRSAAQLGFGVIGTNDLGNPEVMAGGLSTHPVVARRYAEQHHHRRAGRRARGLPAQFRRQRTGGHRVEPGRLGVLLGGEGRASAPELGKGAARRRLHDRPERL